MNIKNLLFSSLIFIPLASHAGAGPTGIGVVKIGMNKAEYISAIGIQPVNCNTFKDSNGKTKRSEMKYLKAESKTLCFGFSFRESGSMENIKVKGVSYDVIEAGYASSKFIKSVGNSSKAIFYKDRLISLEITFPEVGLETLVAKYGQPKLVDKREIEVCSNRMGNKFNNDVGKLDAVWVNGKINTILRADTSSPRKTCTDGITMRYYIIEEPNGLKTIENAIVKYRSEITKEEVKDSPF